MKKVDNGVSSYEIPENATRISLKRFVEQFRAIHAIAVVESETQYP